MIDLAELEKKIVILELEIKNFRSYFDIKVEYIIDYFKKVECLYNRQTEEMVTIKTRCSERLNNCVEKIDDGKIFSLEGRNKKLFQILNILLTFFFGMVSGLIMMSLVRNGK